VVPAITRADPNSETDIEIQLEHSIKLWLNTCKEILRKKT
jgi:hypothetical protein